MDENERLDLFREILISIQEIIKMYQELSPEEKNLLITPSDKNDVKDIFICMYDDMYVGLFRKINWSSRVTEKNDVFPYNAGNIYVGVNSSYIGMELIHSGYVDNKEWQIIGEKVIVDDKSYVANCNMQNSMSFDDMRLIMYCEGKIDSYEIGKADSKEILDVLKYAVSYYQIDQNFPKKKK